MRPGATDGVETSPRPAPLWPYGACAVAIVLVAGVLIVEQHPIGWVMRFVDAALLLAYASALKRRWPLLHPDPAERPRDIGIVAVATFAVVAVTTGAAAALGLIGTDVSATVGLICRGYVILSVARRVGQGNSAGGVELGLQSLRPVHATVGSFAVAILVGWALLTLPGATPLYDAPLQPIDGLFTATSATCVTGLIVKDTPRDFSVFGKIVILGLIQVGGLGIMTFAALFDVIRRRGLSVRRRMIVSDLAVRGEHSGLRGMLKQIVLFTMSVEALGAVALWLRLNGTTGSFGGDVALSVFHSISAFCNAGFSLFSNNLENYVGDPAINITITLLIILGGIGFPVVQALIRRIHLRRLKIRQPLELHTKLALATTGWLLAIGFVGFLGLEWHGTLAGLSMGDRLWAAWFQGVTPRTAGFNTLPIGEVGPAALLLTVLLMVIGASPGSTGGGLKTTTAATLWLITRSMILGSDHVPVFGRAIPADVRHRAVAVAGLYAAATLAGTMLVCMSEPLGLQDALFEVASAIGTVGLSTGVTAALSRVGKSIITLLMFAGRVGPLSLALAITREDNRRSARYPEDHIMVG